MAKSFRSHRFFLGVASAALILTSFPVITQAQDAGDEEQDAVGSIIVTGARIRQGGAQDIKHFRSVSVNGGQSLPHANSLTLEGLMGEHDLTLPAQAACTQLFCVNAQSMAARLPAQPDASVFVGMGFESGVDADSYRNRPLSLIAVVDRSGSMTGPPLQRVKEGLHAALKQMGPGDRMGIVVYGSETNVHMAVMDVEGNRETISKAIDSIAINGSTYMEAGLKLGYDTARAELARSNGDTRLMLFSDENANVGNTSAEGFMGQAFAGAEAGIGLTSIGVGYIFDGVLASKISAVKGGNLFFVDQEGDAAKLFEREFDNMVSEVARDIRITIDPADGFTIAQLYGVPENILTRNPDGSVSAFIGSAFLSSNGGGIFASLTGEGDRTAPASVAIAYEDARTGERGQSAAKVTPVDQNPPEQMVLAQALIDQYSVLHSTLTAFQNGGDIATVQTNLAALSERMKGHNIAGLSSEIALVDGLQKTSAQMVAFQSSPERLKMLAVNGQWEVVRHRGVEDIARGDLVKINNGSFVTERRSGRNAGDDIWQSFDINEQQLHIVGSGLVFHYSIEDDTLRLRNPRDRTSIVLRRIVEA